MTTDEGMNRRDFLRMTGAAAGVAGASGVAAAQEGGNNTTGNQTGNMSGNNTTGNTTGNATAPNGSSGSGGGGTGPIDYGGWLEDAKGWGGDGSTVDKTGQKEVTIKVGVGSGGLAFDPVAVHVDPKTKIVWQWESSGHNVEAENGEFKSQIKNSGTYEYTPKKEGIIPYFCNPHRGQGMKGAIAVGSVKRKAPAAPVTPAVNQATKNLGVATFATMISTLGLAYFFLRYGGDYEE